MPRLPMIRSGALQRLEKVLGELPRQEALAAVGRVEALAVEMDPAVTYPEDWVVFRLTGRQAAGTKGGEQELVKGTVLRRDLGPLAERLCARLGVRDEELGQALDVGGLCKAWNVSRSTVNRLRARGLVGRRVTDAAGATRLVFLPGVVEAFAKAHEQELASAKAFSRMGAGEEARMVRRAGAYRRKLGWSLNQAAVRLAARTGRSVEGVRLALKRAAKATPGLKETGAIGARERAVLMRAWGRGVDLSMMARKMHRSRGAVRRAINMARADRLRAIVKEGSLEGVDERMSAAALERALEAAPARRGLNAGSGSWRDVLGFVKAARGQGPPMGAEEKSRLLAYQALRAGAADVIAQLDALHPSASAVDRAETWLLWAARLKVELVRSQTRLMLDTLSARLGRPVEELAPAAAMGALVGGLRVIGEAVDGLDPAKSGRLAAAAGLLLDRYAAGLAKQAAPAQPKRAMVVLSPGTPMTEWERAVVPWQTSLEPDRRLRTAVEDGRMPAEVTRVLRVRYGWDGGPPRTIAELAAELKMTPIRAYAAERRAVREGLAAVRGYVR